MKENKPLSEHAAITRLMELCGRAEKSSFDIRKKLKDWGLEAKADQIIKRLTDEKFIDDVRFARAFIHDKIFINKWGKIKVKYLLRGQQISDGDIENALTSIDDEAYRKMIFCELQKKKNTMKKLSVFQQKSKLYGFGAQRGYEADLIRRFAESE
jgi:regulatory protein